MAFADIGAWSKSLQQDRGQVSGHCEVTFGEAVEVFAFVNQGFRLHVSLFFSMNRHDIHDARHIAAFNMLGEMIQD